MHLGHSQGRRLKELEGRLFELEDIVEKCSQALNVVPVRSLEKGLTWIPSEEAVRLLRRAQDAALDYTQGRSHGERSD